MTQNIELLKLPSEQKKKAIEKLIESSSPTPAFFLILVLSAIITTIGILMNNVAVVIGGMLVSPLLSPILAISLGIVLSDIKLLWRTFRVLSLAVFYVVAVAFVIALFLVSKEMNNEILSRATPDLLYFGVALASGVAASFALSREEFVERMIGVAVAIALLPPLSVMGIGLAFWDWSIFTGALGLFLVNLLGILLGSLIVFSLLRFYPEKKVASQELKEEEKEFKKVEEKKNGNSK